MVGWCEGGPVEYGGKEMKNESIKQRRMRIDHKGRQGQTQRAVVLQEQLWIQAPSKWFCVVRNLRGRFMVSLSGTKFHSELVLNAAG